MARRKLSTEEVRRKLGQDPAAPSGPNGTGGPRPADLPPDVAEPACPFPIELLPVPLAELVTQAADVLVAPPGYIALPCLTTCAASIGTTRLAYVKDQFVEPAVLWTAVVGSTGSRKSSGYKLALRRLQRHQDRWHDQFLADLADFEAGEYEPAGDGETMVKRKEPVEKQIYTVDTTVDALVDMMIASGRGAYVAVDEQDGWLAGMSRYTATSERAHWLTFYEGNRHIINRRKDKHSRRVQAAAVCIHGGNQPLILRRNLTTENIAAGLFGRFLFACEPEPVPQFHTREIHPDTEREWESVVDNLLGLEHTVDAEGNPVAGVCKFSPDAVAVYGPWWERWQIRRQQTRNPGLNASRAKMVGQAVRLSLVMHLADLAWRQSHGQYVRPDVITDEWATRAMQLCEWFDAQAGIIYGEEDVNTGLLSRIQQHSKPVTPSDLVAWKLYETVEPARADLQGLVEAGKGEWLKKGRKTLFSLFDL